MQTIFFLAFLIAMIGFVFNVARGIEEGKQAHMYYMIENPAYFKRATFFAFMVIVTFALVIFSLR